MDGILLRSVSAGVVADGHLLAWGGVSFWRSLMWLDLIDEFHVSLYPYVADEGTRLFDDVPKAYRLDLVSSTAKRNGSSSCSTGVSARRGGPATPSGSSDLREPAFVLHPRCRYAAGSSIKSFMFKPTDSTVVLSFWDVPAALLGFALAAALSRVPVLGDYGILWMGGPFAAVALRRTLLPTLTPPIAENAPPLSLGRKVAAYGCLIFGGVITLISGSIFYSVATDVRRPEFAWPLLIVLGIGGMIAARGLRWLTEAGR